MGLTWCSRQCLGPPATSVACLWHVSVAGGARCGGCAAAGASECFNGLLVAKGHLAGSDGDVRGADLTIQLGARLGRDTRALVDEGGGAVGRQLTAAQRHGGVLEPLDQTLKTVLRHSGWEC